MTQIPDALPPAISIINPIPKPNPVPKPNPNPVPKANPIPATLDVLVGDSVCARRLQRALPAAVALLACVVAVAEGHPAALLGIPAAILIHADLRNLCPAGLRLQFAPDAAAAGQWRLVDTAGDCARGQLRCHGRFAAVLWLEFRAGGRRRATRHLLLLRDAVAHRDWCLLRRRLRLLGS